MWLDNTAEVDGNTVLEGGALAALGVLPSAQKVLEAVRAHRDKTQSGRG